MLVGQFGNTIFSGQGYHYLLQKWVLQFYHINIKNQTFHRRKCLTKNFRSPGSDDNPDPRLTKNKLAVLTGVISRYSIFYSFYKGVQMKMHRHHFLFTTRFEQMCGAFSPWPSQEVKKSLPWPTATTKTSQLTAPPTSPSEEQNHHGHHQVGDEPNLPTQHTVHARVVKFLPWIVPLIFSESTCNYGQANEGE